MHWIICIVFYALYSMHHKSKLLNSLLNDHLTDWPSDRLTIRPTDVLSQLKSVKLENGILIGADLNSFIFRVNWRTIWIWILCLRRHTALFPCLYGISFKGYWGSLKGYWNCRKEYGANLEHNEAVKKLYWEDSEA